MTAQLALFGDAAAPPPRTEGIKYAGSKLRLLPAVLALARKTGADSVLDGFSGTTRVSQAFAKAGYKVVSNDIAIWSEVFGTCYLLNNEQPQAYRALIEHLNSAREVDGWFTEHYGGEPNGGCSVQSDGLKKPWQRHNTRKLDGIRLEIDRLGLGRVDRAVALTSLILALDRVDNTIGHHASYLNDWSPRSYHPLRLRVPQVFTTEARHEVLREDVFDAVRHTSADLAYLDPPYGSNNHKMPPSRVRYASYYHLWTTVCLFDSPQVFGKAKRRQDTSDPVSASVFEEFRRRDDGRFIAVEAIERLLSASTARWLILSYSSGGRATARELQDVVRGAGHVRDVIQLDYKKNVMGEMRWTDQWIRDGEEPHKEFLFLIERR